MSIAASVNQIIDWVPTGGYSATRSFRNTGNLPWRSCGLSTEASKPDDYGGSRRDVLQAPQGCARRRYCQR